MLTNNVIRSLALKTQTSETNISREYLQHLFLSYFYRHPRSTEDIFFKGGTALRVVFLSPRFSEDLDFSASLGKIGIIEKSIVETIKEIEREGIKAEISESKETSGGYLSELSFFLNEQQVKILLQFSSRIPRNMGEVVTISSEFIPPYTLVMLERGQLVKEKVQALLTRAKPRDFYDIYFLIRSRLLRKEDKDLLIQVRNKLEQKSINFEQELKIFLPKSHWPIIRDFKKSLNFELERYI